MPMNAQTIIQITMNIFRSSRFKPSETSALDANFRAIINDRKPMVTLIVFSRLLDLINTLRMAGNTNGSARPIAKPNKPITGPRRLTLNARSKTSAMIGKVDAKEAPGSVSAIIMMPLTSFDTALFANELIHDSGSFIENPPRKEMPRTIYVRHR